MYTIDSEMATKIRGWLADGKLIAVWQNKDLGSPSIGCYAFTPFQRVENETPPSPHWRYGRSPITVIESMDRFNVITWIERARVKVRPGPPYLGGIHRADRGKLDKALALAGDSANWRADWSTREYGSAWFTAIVETPHPVTA